MNIRLKNDRRATVAGSRLLVLFCAAFTLMVTARAEEFKAVTIDFSRPEAAGQVIAEGRYSMRAEDGFIQLRGGSGVISRERTGPGYYHFRFALHEPESFEYHVPQLVFFVTDPDDLQLGGRVQNQHDAYSLRWPPSGIISFQRVSGGESESGGSFIHPGRDNPNRYEAGQFVDVTLEVPKEGRVVYIRTYNQDGSGERTTGFRLREDIPLQGHFGVINPKWFSHMHVQVMRYRPAE